MPYRVGFERVLLLLRSKYLLENFEISFGECSYKNIQDIVSLQKKSLTLSQIHPYFAKVMAWKKRILGTYLKELEKRELKTLSKVLFSCCKERTFLMKIP